MVNFDILKSNLISQDIPENRSRKICIVQNIVQFLTRAQRSQLKERNYKIDRKLKPLVKSCTQNALCELDFGELNFLLKNISELRNQFGQYHKQKTHSSFTQFFSPYKGLSDQHFKDLIFEIQAIRVDKVTQSSKDAAVAMELVDYYASSSDLRTLKNFFPVLCCMPHSLMKMAQWQELFIQIISDCQFDFEPATMSLNDEAFISFYRYHPLKEKHLDLIANKNDLEKKSIVEIVSRLLEFRQKETLQLLFDFSNRITILSLVSDSALVFYFTTVQFIPDNFVNISSLNDDELNLFNRLIKFDLGNAIYCFYESEWVRDLLRKCLSEDQSKFTYIRALFKVHEKYSNLIKFRGFLAAFVFIELHFNKIVSKQIGKYSRKNHFIRKTKGPAKSTIFYNTKTKNIYIKTFLIEGGFKTIKKIYDYAEESIEVETRQRINDTLPRHRSLIESEIEIMERFKGNPYIVQCYSHNEYKSKDGTSTVVMTMPWYEGNSLSELLQNNIPDRIQVLNIMKDILLGIITLHGERIYHRDIKKDNIFIKLDIDESGKIVPRGVIGDLGLACYKDTKEATKRVGTPAYATPEESVSFGTDKWSLGLLFYELYYNKEVPFINKDTRDLRDNQSMYNALDLEKQPDNVESVEYVIWSLLRNDPEARIDLLEALAIVEAACTLESKKEVA